MDISAPLTYDQVRTVIYFLTKTIHYLLQIEIESVPDVDLTFYLANYDWRVSPDTFRGTFYVDLKVSILIVGLLR